MDKYEYKVCLDDIKKSVQEKDFRRAAAIADTVEWRRVKSVKTLCMVSDIYKANQRYSESKDVLMLAYTRDPENGQILYALCDLELLLDDYLRAMQFYNKFVSISPRDPNRYILQYKLMEAQDVSLDERIAVLEELKKRTFKDRWVYELSNLYDRRGLYGRCAELCDELIAHGKPKYVRQALELRTEHGPPSCSTYHQRRDSGYRGNDRHEPGTSVEFRKAGGFCREADGRRHGKYRRAPGSGGGRPPRGHEGRADREGEGETARGEAQ